MHRPRELVVQLAAQGIEFLGHVEGDYGDFAFVVDEDAWFGHGGYLGREMLGWIVESC